MPKPRKNRPPGKVTRLTGKKKKEVDAGLAQFQKEIDFYEAHYKEFLKKYPDQWVGILDEKLMGVAETRAELRAKFKAEGTPMNFMFVKRLTTKREI